MYFRYSVDEENRFFSIDESSGELFTTGVLDREAVAFYRLTVIARDTHPTHPLSSSTLVTVLIRDVNDHWPQFLYSPYVANMPAGSAPGEGYSKRNQSQICFCDLLWRDLNSYLFIYDILTFVIMQALLYVQCKQ